ncbi:unnamed protein product [Bursaphelenchus okinawaensis]|uniref:Uncharacterized protein n=1 Tax=Bursaphelenchus okinawaensis TaxID=465554 RepID=A0A811JS99_9BILA|nr:unnamed protein product [Bursaphelenchus okinawaensis]CAG9081278.1 unnamed protein product [Bursaphelenchus okinawaensis]
MDINLATYLLAVSTLLTLHLVSSLECIQCDRHGAWYSPEETERHVQKCQNGLIDPTPCLNASHTHCIYSYYRQGVSNVITVTERRCGVEADILGCTLYKSSRKRMKRHFLDSSQKTGQKRRDTDTLFVEVCTEGCEGDGCLNSAFSSAASALLTGLLVLFLV